MTSVFKAHRGWRQLRVASLAVVAVSSEAAAQRGELSNTELVAKVADAIVVIETFDRSGRLLSTGSGFFVSAAGLLATNFHVVEGAASATAKRRTGEIVQLAGFVAADPTHDIVVLQAVITRVPALAMASADSVRPGDDVIVVGAPLGFSQTVTSGTASGITLREGVGWLQFSALVSFGSSGSPVLDRQGRVVGMTTWGRTDAPQLNFATPSNYIEALIARSDSVRALSELPRSEPRVAVGGSAAPPDAAPEGTGFYRFSTLTGYAYEFAWLVRNPGGRLTGALFAPHPTGFVDVYPIQHGIVPGRRRGFEFQVGCVLFEGWFRDDGVLAGDTRDACEERVFNAFQADPVASDPARTAPLEGVKLFKVRSDSTGAGRAWAWIVVVGPKKLGEGTVGAAHVWGALPSGAGRRDLVFPRGRADSSRARLETVARDLRVELTEASGAVAATVYATPDSGALLRLRGYRWDLVDCFDAASDSARWRSRLREVASSLPRLVDSMRVVERVLQGDSLRLYAEAGALSASEREINSLRNRSIRARRQPWEERLGAFRATRARLESEQEALRRRLAAATRCP